MPAQAQCRRAKEQPARSRLSPGGGVAPAPAYITQALICFNIKPLHRYALKNSRKAQRRYQKNSRREPLYAGA